VCFGVGIDVGGNDDGSAGTSVDDDGNINLSIGLRCGFWRSSDAETVSN